MKKLIAKLLQIESRGLAAGINEAQDVVDTEFRKAYITKVGYKTGQEVQGINTLSQEADFSEQETEGTALIQNNDILSSQTSADVFEDDPIILSTSTFERGYVGTPFLNAVSFFTPGVTVKKPSAYGTDRTGQEYKTGYKYNYISVAAPQEYENLLKELSNVDIDRELDNVRK